MNHDLADTGGIQIDGASGRGCPGGTVYHQQNRDGDNHTYVGKQDRVMPGVGRVEGREGGTDGVRRRGQVDHLDFVCRHVVDAAADDQHAAVLEQGRGVSHTRRAQTADQFTDVGDGVVSDDGGGDGAVCIETTTSDECAS